MTTLGENLQKLIKIHDISISELARQTGIKQPVLYLIVTGKTQNPQLNNITALAQFFRISIDDLVGLNFSESIKDKTEWTKIPIISFEEACVWPNVEINDSYQFTKVDAPVNDLMFALEVKDNSMYPLFIEGSLLIVKPGIEPTHRDYVIACIESETEAKFRQILYEGNDIYLKPLSNDYVLLQIKNLKKLHICGVVTEARMDLNK